MKLFAKRTRRVVDPDEAEKVLKEQDAAKEAAGKEEADKVVQELLKMDPSQLNSKKRRMIKRYRKRTGETFDDAPTFPAEEKKRQKFDVECQKTDMRDHDSPEALGRRKMEPEAAESQDISDFSSNVSEAVERDDSQESGSVEESKKVLEGLNSKSRRELLRRLTRDGDAAVKEVNDEAVSLRNEMKNPPKTEAEVRFILDKLKSKSRRKLTRRLEREGETALSDVYEEAVSLLGEMNDGKGTNEVEEEVGKRRESIPNNKRKKDWSDLPPEERFRREEQRRLQKEAAEQRRASSSNGKQRHPLNSERRRANRRKPSWERKRPVSSQNEHDTSGYEMRKMMRASR